MEKTRHLFLVALLALIATALPAKINAATVDVINVSATSNANQKAEVDLLLKVSGPITLNGFTDNSVPAYNTSTGELRLKKTIDPKMQGVGNIAGHVESIKDEGHTLAWLTATSKTLESVDVNGSTTLESLSFDYCPLLKTIDCSNTQMSSIYITGDNNVETLIANNTHAIEAMWLRKWYSLKTLKMNNCEELIYLPLPTGTMNAGQITPQGLSALPLEKIEVSNNPNLSGIEIGGSTGLKEIIASNNKITNLEIGSLVGLETLNISKNPIEGIGLSNAVNLKKLECDETNISNLGLKDCPNLKILKARKMPKLTTLDLGGLKNIEDVDCNESAVTDIKVTGCDGLKTLFCDKTPIKAINVSGLKALTNLSLAGTKNLTDVNVAGCSSLANLDCLGSLKLTRLDMSNLPELKKIESPECGLKELIVDNCPKLTEINCSINELQKLVLPKLPSLRILNCASNKNLKKFEIKNCINLEELNCSKTELTDLNVDNMKQLKKVNASNSPIATFKAKGCPKLESVDLNHTQLGSLDISESNVRVATVDESKLNIIKAKNCKKLTTLSCKANVNLKEIELAGCTNLEDLDCERTAVRNLVCKNSKLKKISVKGCDNLVSMDLDHNELGSLNIEESNIQELSINENLIKFITFKKCPKLKTLSCTHNAQLTQLNLSEAPAIQKLNIAHTGVKQLDVKGLPLLEELNADNTKLISLDITESNIRVATINESLLESINFKKCPKLTKVSFNGNAKLMKANLEGCTKLEHFEGAKNPVKFYNFSGMDNLSHVSIYDCDINEASMRKVVATLVDRKGNEPGYFLVFSKRVADKNVFTPEHIKMLNKLNWKSYYINLDDSIVLYEGSIAGVNDVAVDGVATVKAIYTLDGRRISRMQPGINILMMSDGKTLKVMK